MALSFCLLYFACLDQISLVTRNIQQAKQDLVVIACFDRF